MDHSVSEMSEKIEKSQSHLSLYKLSCIIQMSCFI